MLCKKLVLNFTSVIQSHGKCTTLNGHSTSVQNFENVFSRRHYIIVQHT